MIPVEQPSLNIKERISDATYDVNTRSISISLSNCKVRAKVHKIEYYEYVARCINHEWLHHILSIEQCNFTTHQLDNIAKYYKEYWMW